MYAVSSILPRDRALSGATTPGQSGLGSDGNEGVLRIPQSSSTAGTSPSDCLVSYPRHSLGGGLTPLQRSSRCILQPQPTGQSINKEGGYCYKRNYKTPKNKVLHYFQNNLHSLKYVFPSINKLFFYSFRKEIFELRFQPFADGILHFIDWDVFPGEIIWNMEVREVICWLNGEYEQIFAIK